MIQRYSMWCALSHGHKMTPVDMGESAEGGYVTWADHKGRLAQLEAALYGAAESLATFRPPHEPDNLPRWTELDEVTLRDARQLCGKYPQSETEGK